jgi:hypothetical protein
LPGFTTHHIKHIALRHFANDYEIGYEKMSFDISSAYKLSNGYRNYNITSSSAIWNNIPRKGMPAPSEADIKNELLELAEHVAKISAESQDKFDPRIKNATRRMDSLYMQYVSYASPDRKKMFEEAKQTLRGGGGSEPGSKQLSLIDVLLEKSANKGKPEYKAQVLPCGAGLEPIASPAGNGFELSIGGEPVLSYVGGTFVTILTRGEQARMNEIVKFCNDARKTAKQNIANEPPKKSTVDVIV